MLVLLLFSIFPNNKLSIASNMVDFYWLLVKTTIFDDFRLFWAFFWRFLTQFSKMAEYNHFIFPATLVHSNIFRVRLKRAFFDAWFAQNEFLTELNLALSGVHFSFTTTFQYLKFVWFCSYSKLNFSYGCNLQWWKPFVDIFFHLWEISKQTLGNIKKTGLILSSETVNMLIRGVAAAMRVVRNHSKSISVVFFLYL